MYQQALHTWKVCMYLVHYCCITVAIGVRIISWCQVEYAPHMVTICAIKFDNR